MDVEYIVLAIVAIVGIVLWYKKLISAESLKYVALVILTLGTWIWFSGRKKMDIEKAKDDIEKKGKDAAKLEGKAEVHEENAKKSLEDAEKKDKEADKKLNEANELEDKIEENKKAEKKLIKKHDEEIDKVDDMTMDDLDGELKERVDDKV